MGLIAKKPCSFGGKKFFIGDEIPASLVTNPNAQEKLGVITIGQNGSKEVPVASAGTFTREQVEEMIASAVAETKDKSEEPRQDTILIPVKGEDGTSIEIPAAPEEIRKAFEIMQMNAADGAEVLAGVKSENVLILIHASDSRKTIKEAAKRQADNLFSVHGDSNEAGAHIETTDTKTEGADA